jgi:hypothetical protein
MLPVEYITTKHLFANVDHENWGMYIVVGCKNDQSTRNNCNYHYLLRQDDTI